MLNAICNSSYVDLSGNSWMNLHNESLTVCHLTYWLRLMTKFSVVDSSSQLTVSGFIEVQSIPIIICKPKIFTAWNTIFNLHLINTLDYQSAWWEKDRLPSKTAWRTPTHMRRQTNKKWLWSNYQEVQRNQGQIEFQNDGCNSVRPSVSPRCLTLSAWHGGIHANSKFCLFTFYVGASPRPWRLPWQQAPASFLHCSAPAQQRNP